jgi:hypothetical protein
MLAMNAPRVAAIMRGEDVPMPEFSQLRQAWETFKAQRATVTSSNSAGIASPNVLRGRHGLFVK